MQSLCNIPPAKVLAYARLSRPPVEGGLETKVLGINVFHPLRQGVDGAERKRGSIGGMLSCF